MPVMLERRQLPVDGSENLLRQVINILRPNIITAEPLMDERRIEVDETFPGRLIAGRLAQSFQQAVRGLGHGNSQVELQGIHYVASGPLPQSKRGTQCAATASFRPHNPRASPSGGEILCLPWLGRTDGRKQRGLAAMARPRSLGARGEVILQLHLQPQEWSRDSHS